MAPPFNPEDITREAAALLQQYRLQTVTGDKIRSGYQAAAWRKAGINKKDSERDTSGNYLEMLSGRELRRRPATRSRPRAAGTPDPREKDPAPEAGTGSTTGEARTTTWLPRSPGAIAEARTTATLKLKWKHDGME